MSNSNPLELAKKGDPQAISYLINQELKAKGVVCKVNLKDYCLNILVEAESLPNQEEYVQFLKKGLLSLKPNGIERVKVFGKKIGEKLPDWNTSFEIIESINPFFNPNSQVASHESIPAQPSTDEGNLSFQAYGKNGKIILKPKRLLISREGMFGFLSQGVAGVKEIPLKNITAIQFKECGDITVGFLQLSLLGGFESQGGVLSATKDENTVTFERDQQPNFKEVKRFLDAFIDGEPISIANLQFTDSRIGTQYGLVTQDEFEKLEKKSNARTQQISYSVSSFFEQLIGLFKGILNGSAFKIKVDPKDRIAVANKKNIAFVLALFLGVFGAHKFFLGYYKEGFITLSLFFVAPPLLSLTLGIVSPALGAIILVILILALFFISILEAFTYVNKSPADFANTYLKHKKGWL